ncbi:MAG: carboxypeptidase-like regulatory domain-containing protein [Chitinophagaceae bacterium]|nr:carboxypeptidase-like regulatory domain-containing protein [Chitinophagaceae bacterium]
MRFYRAFIFLLFLIPAFLACRTVAAQARTVHGIIVDSATQSPLASATITVKETNKRTLSDADGRFSIQRVGAGSTLIIGYTGYAVKRVLIQNISDTLHIAISRKTEALNEVVVTSDLNPAHRIVLLMQENRKQNDPLYIQSYEYNAYTIAEVGGMPYLWRIAEGKVDSSRRHRVRPQKKTDMVDSIQDRHEDSTMKELVKNYLFVAESYTDKKYRYPRQVKETVLATRISGIKHPMMAITTANFEYFGFYFDYPRINERTYTSPIVPGSISLYRFVLREMIPHGKDTTYVISFEPRAGKNFTGLKGSLYINSDRYAIEQVTAAPADERSMAQGFRLHQQYERVKGQWFPKQLDLYTTQKDLKNDSALFYFDTRTTLSHIALDKSFSVNEFSDIAMEFPRDAGRRSEEEWKALRPDSLSIKDQATYRAYEHMPSELLGMLNLINGLTEALALQAIPVGKIDLPFQYLFSGVNPYEKFRIGAGAQTNLLFSKWVSIGGYAGYGIGDKAWKYGGNVLFTFNRRNHTELRFSFAQDLREPGNVPYFIENETLYSIKTLRGFFSSRLDSMREWKVQFNTKPWPNFQANAWLLTEERGPAGFSYGFDIKGNNQFISRYQNTEAGIGFRYTTRETYARVGRAIIPNTQPWTKILMQVSKGLPGTMNGQLDYTKFALLYFQRFNTKHFGETSFQLELGKLWGDVPYAYLFNVPGVGQQQGTLASGLFVGNTFQTVGPYEFSSANAATFFLQQNFSNLLFKPGSANIRPSIILAQNISYGTLPHPEKHNGLNLQSPDKGLYETGLLINDLYRINLRIFYLGVGVGVFRRYGYYELPDAAKNWAFKFGFAVSH